MKKLVTPEMAAKWLDNNDHNRKISTKSVNKIAKAMIENKWAYNGEGVIISTEGSLLDGQHRLLAVIKSNKEIWMEVIEKIPEVCEYTGINVFSTIDTGKSRTASDVISIYDKNVKPTDIVKTIRAIQSVDMMVLKNGRGGSSAVTNESVLEFYMNRGQEIQDVLENAIELKENNQYPYIDKYDFVTLIYSLRKEPKDTTSKFLNMMSKYTEEAAIDGELCGGENENLCRIVGLLYKKLSETYEIAGGGNVFNKIKYIGFFKAYHYFIENIKTGMGIGRNMDIIYPESIRDNTKTDV